MSAPSLPSWSFPSFGEENSSTLAKPTATEPPVLELDHSEFIKQITHKKEEVHNNDPDGICAKIAKICEEAERDLLESEKRRAEELQRLKKTFYLGSLVEAQ